MITTSTKQNIKKWVDEAVEELFIRTEKIMSTGSDGYGSPSIEIKVIVQQGKITQITIGDIHKKIK